MSAKRTSAAVGVCLHDTTHEVKAESGAVLAVRCTGCTAILGATGTCDGCKSTTKQRREARGFMPSIEDFVVDLRERRV